jgi:membrane protein
MNREPLDRRRRARALVDLLRATWSEYERDYAGFLASAMIYYALMSLVPLLLLLFAALGLLLRFSDLAAALEVQVLDSIGARFGADLPATIGRILDQLQQGSIVATAVSLAGLLLTASVLFKKLRLSFRAIWKYEPPLVSGSVRAVIRSTLLEQVISFIMVLSGAPLLLLSLALLAIVQWLTGLFSNVPLAGDTLVWLLALPIPLVIVTFTFGLLFMFLPPVRLRWRDVSLASVLCASAWFVAAEILALYVLCFGTSLSAYGAIGALLMIMLWMNVISQCLFYGAELCKVIATRGITRTGTSTNAAALVLVAILASWQHNAIDKDPVDDLASAFDRSNESVLNAIDKSLQFAPPSMRPGG